MAAGFMQWRSADDTEQGNSARPPVETPDWERTVRGIRAGDPLAMTELYSVFTRGIRYLLLRSLGVEDIDDRVHDCFVVVIEAIRSDELRDPARIMGYARTVVRRHIAAHIEERAAKRRSDVEFEDSLFGFPDWKSNPEERLLAKQRSEIAHKVLRAFPVRDREILQRFYMQGQSQEVICEEMGLSYNQFRTLKTRAKARFGKLGKRLASHGSPD